MAEQVKAARYYAAICKDDGKWWVWMQDDDGYHSAIQKCRSKDTCDNAVLRWQLKENLAVQKENRRLANLKEKQA